MTLSTKTRATTCPWRSPAPSRSPRAARPTRAAATRPAAAAATDPEQLSGDLTGAGSSAQQAAMQAWQAGFNGEQPDVTVNYDPVGSGGGREQFLAGGVDFAGSDSALKRRGADRRPGPLRRRRRLRAAELHLGDRGDLQPATGVDELNLAPATVAGIFSGAITTWNDPEIAADNPDADAAEHGHHAGAPRRQVGHHGELHRLPEQGRRRRVDRRQGRRVADQGGEAANGTSGVIAAVTGGQGTIGYADESQAGDLGIANVKVGDEFVDADPGGRRDRRRRVRAGRGPRRERLRHLGEPRRPTSADEYPIVLVSYHIGCVEVRRPGEGRRW